MKFEGFMAEDFQVFEMPGLEKRMEALISTVRPKLEQLGQEASPMLSVLCGEEMFPHVARHARRTVNPPDDSWVAWANQKRGYKAHPHFQVGLWSTHLFIQFALIYESENKSVFARHFEQKLGEIVPAIPGHFFWSQDHMQPRGRLHKEMQISDFESLIHRLRNVKKAEVVCGIQLNKDDPTVSDGPKLLQTIEHAFKTLAPLYRISFEKVLSL